MKYKKRILAALMACLLLSGCAGEAQDEHPANSVAQQQQAAVLPMEDQDEMSISTPEQPTAEEPTTVTQPDAVSSATPEESVTPKPAEPEEEQITQTVNTCTISISCSTVLEHMDALTAGKEDLVPSDGWLLPPMEVTFHEGENVFQILRRTCKQQKIHMEFEDTPIYNSAYIEGIGNLYEFDCGELSGWKYRVNGWFPNYGCSRYQVQSGDRIEWLYTCDLGADIGGGESQ